MKCTVVSLVLGGFSLRFERKRNYHCDDTITNPTNEHTAVEIIRLSVFNAVPY